MDWKDLLSHAAAEEKAFNKRAAAKRAEWLTCRRKRDWLGALQAKSREQEYRSSARQRRAFILENKSRI